MAEAADFVCAGAQAQGVVIPTSVTVPVGEWCTLDQAQVSGSITVLGSLAMTGGKVSGSVTGTDGQIGLIGVTVGNSVTSFMPRTKFFQAPALTICGSTVGGSVTARNAVSGHPISLGAIFCAEGGVNKVGGGVYYLNNGAASAQYLWNTTVGGNFVCQAGTVPNLANNTVKGQVINTCAAIIP